jgi:hypothetical protein
MLGINLGEKTKVILRNVLLAIVLAAIMILVPQLIGFGKSAFLDQALLNQFQFYINVGIVYLVVTILIFGLLMFLGHIKEKWKEYQFAVPFASQGEFPSISFFKRFSNFQIFLFSLIVFAILGLTNFLTSQISFIGVGKLIAQQFTATDNIVYSSALIPASENLGAILVIALCILGLILLAIKYKWNSGTIRAFAFTLIPIIVGIYGLTNHILRYGISDFNLVYVFLFWTIGGLITVITGSFIPFWVMHINNNLFIDLKTYFTSDAVTTWAAIAIIVLIILFVILYARKKKNKGVAVNYS